MARLEHISIHSRHSALRSILRRGMWKALGADRFAAVQIRTAYLIIYGLLQDLYPSLHGMQCVLTLQELPQVPTFIILLTAQIFRKARWQQSHPQKPLHV